LLEEFLGVELVAEPAMDAFVASEAEHDEITGFFSQTAGLIRAVDQVMGVKGTLERLLGLLRRLASAALATEVE
jgi:hypothetical protein